MAHLHHQQLQAHYTTRHRNQAILPINASSLPAPQLNIIAHKARNSPRDIHRLRYKGVCFKPMNS